MNAGGAPGFPSRHVPAMARKGALLRVNRVLSLRFFLPVNSKNAQGGIRQPLLFEVSEVRRRA